MKRDDPDARSREGDALAPQAVIAVRRAVTLAPAAAAPWARTPAPAPAAVTAAAPASAPAALVAGVAAAAARRAANTAVPGGTAAEAAGGGRAGPVVRDGAFPGTVGTKGEEWLLVTQWDPRGGGWGGAPGPGAQWEAGRETSGRCFPSLSAWRAASLGVMDSKQIPTKAVQRPWPARHH